MPNLQIVAGVDLGPVPIDETVPLADHVVVRAAEMGIDLEQFVASGHRIIGTGHSTHTVATFTCPGAGEWQLWHACLAAAADSSARAVVVGRRAQGDVDGVAAAKIAAEERRLRIGGRATHFPGADQLLGVMSVGQILATSAIQVVAEIAEDPLPVDVEVATGGRVHPRWEFGALTLHVQDSGHGLYMPFETGARLRT